MLILLLPHIFSEVIEQCTLPDLKDIVISKFYRDDCPHCQKIKPLIGEIDHKLNEGGIRTRVRSVECSRCDCSGVDAVPTIVVSRDGVEIGRFRGYRDYEFISSFMSKVLKIDPSVLERRPDEGPKTVIKLEEGDFQRGLRGPHVILFFDRNKDKLRDMISELNKFFEGKITFGEARGSDMPLITHRYGITDFPTLLGIYDGVSTFYHGEQDLMPLIAWCEKLVAPAFENVSQNRFSEISLELQKGEPLYIVFYNNLRAANDRFSRLTHQLRARAKFVKTSDPALFRAAGVAPTDQNPVILAVYRNNLFHAYSGNLSDEDETLAWIYNAHYPLLTRITQQTFSSVFYGFKPVLLLLTTADFLLSEFESYVERAHASLPYTSFLHAVVNYEEFSAVLKQSLRNLRVPALLIYDPIEKKFHGENMAVTKETLSFIATRLSVKYLDNSLPLYGIQSFRKQYFALGVFVIGLIALGYRRSSKTLKLH